MKVRWILSAVVVVMVVLASSFVILRHPEGREHPQISLPVSRIVVWYTNVVPVHIAGADPDLLIVEPEEIDAQWVSRYRTAGTTVLGYVNFGMAERWRSYWNVSWNISPPEWIGPESEDWQGEYIVQFWHPDWISILNASLKMLVSEGYNGVLLDNLDVTEFWNYMDIRADQLLVDTIDQMRDGLPSAFLIYANLGGRHDLVYNPDFMDVIDGLMREDVWTGEEDEIKSVLDALLFARDQGKDVIVLDYAGGRREVETLLSSSAKYGLSACVSTRELDDLPKYLPVYHGVQEIGSHVITSERRPWDVFRVYVDGMSVGVGERASAAERDGSLLIAWDAERNGTNIVIIMFNGRIIYETEPVSLSPSAASTEDGFAVFYCSKDDDQWDIRVVKFDLNGGMICDEPVTAGERDELWPVSSSDGEAVLFYSDGDLNLTDKSEVKTVAEDVEAYAYGIVHMGGGFAVLYCSNGTGYALLPDGRRIAGIPRILWETNVAADADGLYYIDRDGEVIFLRQDGSWDVVLRIDSVWSAGMSLTVSDGIITVRGPFGHLFQSEEM